MRNLCAHICLITALLLVEPCLYIRPDARGNNGANKISQAGPEASLEQNLWTFMCPAHIGLGTIKNGTIVTVNDYVARLLGVSRQELQGQAARMLYPGQKEYDFVHSKLNKLESREEPLSIETRWKSKDGSIRDVHLYSALLEPGKPSAGFVFTVQDITPLKQADRSFKQRIQAVQGSDFDSCDFKTRFVSLVQKYPGILDKTRTCWRQGLSGSRC